MHEGDSMRFPLDPPSTNHKAQIVQDWCRLGSGNQLCKSVCIICTCLTYNSEFAMLNIDSCLLSVLSNVAATRAERSHSTEVVKPLSGLVLEEESVRGKTSAKRCNAYSTRMSTLT